MFKDLADAVNDPLFTGFGSSAYNSIQAYSTGKGMTKTYWMGMEEEKKTNPFLDAEFENQVESILSDLGYTRTSEYEKGMTVVKIEYDMAENYEEQSRLSPVHGIKGTETSVDYYGHINTDVKRGRVDWTTENYIAKKYDKSMTIMAANAKDDLRWMVRVHARWGSNDIRRVLKTMVQSATPYVDKNTDGWVRVNIEQ
jgi:hypothetical protein